ncbi:nicotinate-nucleotide--dimethylbenzimidazole phosphoribosyltransferase [Streptomyces sp. Li-HN-5-11]|uniref:nicotinate-nucleotide--dimethylbenzimidazole phosphoribosyltransferase n=1 Tax=Streptomyces sp. Li-HN-5-11 TaxID=3075432 RepID=UPI0028A67B88|nr:nicotinate-nucleotide--dimethylbenzimidazole phosphoribosyltransferase [Streptomyces sp. Li-HN-5-11]WNM34018.1 nicotinate-nucleotide--dimethylbenzimidazole phosphoribosyltransferase [Streptomyces sp. Li-HN-5-11]
MTDTGQVPGEGQPESAGMVEQPGVPAHGAYTYLSETPAEDEDLLLPGSHGAWGNEVPPPAPEPVVEAVHEPGPHETSGRDSGSVDLRGVLHPDAAPAVPPAATAPRRPLHLGPPIPDVSASPVRSLADRGPADAPVRHPGPPATGPEYLDAPRHVREMAPQGAAPWGAQAAVAAPPQAAGATAAETVVPGGGPGSAAEAAMARIAAQAGAAARPAPHAPGTARPQADTEAVREQTVEPEGTQAGVAVSAGHVPDAGEGVQQPGGTEAVPEPVGDHAVVAGQGPEGVQPGAAVSAGHVPDAGEGVQQPGGTEAVEQTVEPEGTQAGVAVSAGHVPDAGEGVQQPGGAEAVPEPVDDQQSAIGQGPEVSRAREDDEVSEPRHEAYGPQATVGDPAPGPGQEPEGAHAGAGTAHAAEPALSGHAAETDHHRTTETPEAVREPETGPEAPFAAEAGQASAEAHAVEAGRLPDGPALEGEQAPQALQAPGAVHIQTQHAAEASAVPQAPVPAQEPAAAQQVTEATQATADATVSGPAPTHGHPHDVPGPAPVPATADTAPGTTPVEGFPPSADSRPAGLPANTVQGPPPGQTGDQAQQSLAAQQHPVAGAPTAPVEANPGAADPHPAEHAAPAAHLAAPAVHDQDSSAAADQPAPADAAPQSVPHEAPVAPGAEEAGPTHPHESGTDQQAALPAEEQAPQGEPDPADPGATAPDDAEPLAAPSETEAAEGPGTPEALADPEAAGPLEAPAAAAPAPETQPGHAPGTPLAGGVPAQPRPGEPIGQFVPVEGSVPATPHLAPAAQQPEEPVVTVPAPRDGGTVPAAPGEGPDPEAVQHADDLDTQVADQEAHQAEHQEAHPAEHQEESTAAVAEPRQSTGPAAPGYDEAEREAVLKVMRERRDIRNGFRNDPIPHEVLLRVLEAAHTAPSVGHSQPWDFVVIRSADTRRAMHELAMRQRDAYAKSLPKGRAKQFKELKIEAILDTPVNIVVTADPTRGGRHTLGRHTQPQMAPYSAALAVENLWLAARAEGLGVGWVSFFDEREMVRALGLPEHLEVIAYLCVGYVDEFPDEPELMQAGWSKRRPLSWVVHEETYGRRALPGEEPHDLLAETVAQIRPLDAKALGEAWERQKRMTKPAGALGMLEIISAQLSGLSRQCPPPIPEPAAVAIFAGDHGVHAQGVTPWPQEVTAQMVANFLGGGAVCNAFAGQVGAEVCVVDVGVAADLPATPGLLPRKIRGGTSDMTTGPAMTREEAKKAIEVGIETARDLVAAGNKALLTGEMGIANTTASAALIAVFTGADPSEVTGRGTGINDETLARKTEVVRRALELHQPDPADPIGVLAALGGFEHAAMVGLLLGGASLRTPVILDGVSAGAAALVARAIAPEVLAACIAGHRSAEPGHVAALNKLGLRPLVDLDLRLGEGTGALLALPLVQSTARAMHEVATFDSAGVTEK